MVWEVLLIAQTTKDISIDMLKKLIKVSGDKIVTGYVRFKKIKPCKGYKEAKKKALWHLSRVYKARPNEDGSYAAVIRFNWIFIIIPLLVFLIFINIMMQRPKAKIREEIQTPFYIDPESVIEDYSNNITELYINVPGFSDINMDESNHIMSLYNPEENEAILQYEIYIQNQLVESTEGILPGMDVEINFYERLSKGMYKMKIITKACSLNGETEYNSVSQTIQLTVW